MHNKIKSKIKDKKLIELRRQEIINAAVQLFIKNGFHQTTVRQIAKEFGMSMGALYDYIRNKEDILFLVCDYIHSSVSEKLKNSIADDKSAIDNLRKAIADYFIIIDKNQDYMLLLYQETKSLSRSARKYIFKAESELTSIFEDILKQCIKEKTVSINHKKAKLIANNIMVIGQMWAFRLWSLHDNYSINSYIKTETELILKGIN